MAHIVLWVFALLLNFDRTYGVFRQPWFSFPAAGTVKEEVIVVKLGGSCITDKSQFETLNKELLNSIARDLEKAQGHGHRFILVHGAGSFGHHTAREYELSKGGNVSTWAEGFSRTHRSVTKLNNLVLQALHNRGLRRVLHWPIFPDVTTCGKSNIADIGTLSREKLCNVLNAGFIPLLHGSMVFDEMHRCSVLSGDKIVSCICKTFNNDRPAWWWLDKPRSSDFHVKRCVFLTDVDGVFDVNPLEHSDAKLIKRIIVDRRGVPLERFFQDVERKADQKSSKRRASVDVTGGMNSKLATSYQTVAQSSCPVYIVKAGSKDALLALTGQLPKLGTEIISQ